MTQEDILELIIEDNDNDNFIDVEAWFDIFYFENNKKYVYHQKIFYCKIIIKPFS